VTVVGVFVRFALQCSRFRNIENFDPAGWDIALFAIGSAATKITRRASRRRELYGDRQLVAHRGPPTTADRAG
jgi:hypothetical protein